MRVFHTNISNICKCIQNYVNRHLKTSPKTLISMQAISILVFSKLKDKLFTPGALRTISTCRYLDDGVSWEHISPGPVNKADGT